VIKLNRMTEYGIAVMASVATSAENGWATATGIAASTGLGSPTVAKLLKTLAKGGLLTSQRGATGGYRLSREAEAISLAEIIELLDGGVSLTDCANPDDSCDCDIACPTKGRWSAINNAVRGAFASVSLASMCVKEAGQ
jgi:FeS assembly SUF system regulator